MSKTAISDLQTNFIDTATLSSKDGQTNATSSGSLNKYYGIRMNGGEYNKVFAESRPGNLSSMNGKKEYRACPSGWEYGNSDGKKNTCYEVCNPGYTGYDDTCYENCPGTSGSFGFSTTSVSDLTCTSTASVFTKETRRSDQGCPQDQTEPDDKVNGRCFEASIGKWYWNDCPDRWAKICGCCDWGCKGGDCMPGRYEMRWSGCNCHRDLYKRCPAGYDYTNNHDTCRKQGCPAGSAPYTWTDRGDTCTPDSYTKKTYSRAKTAKPDYSFSPYKTT